MISSSRPRLDTPKIHSMNNRFHSEAKIPWSYDYPLGNHIATYKSSTDREVPLFSRLYPFFRYLRKIFPPKGLNAPSLRSRVVCPIVNNSETATCWRATSRSTETRCCWWIRKELPLTHTYIGPGLGDWISLTHRQPRHICACAEPLSSENVMPRQKSV